MARTKREIMIIDFEKCLRVPLEDQALARESEPMRCPVCAAAAGGLTLRTVSGKLRFGDDQPPICDDHEEPVVMVPIAA